MTDVPIIQNQATDLLGKSTDWFLYERDMLHERVKELSTASCSEQQEQYRKI